MRILTGAVGATLLTVSLAAQAWAADATPVATPLSAGKAAGIQKAQGESTTLLWVAGIGIVATGIVLAVENHHDNAPAATATSTGTAG